VTSADTGADTITFTGATGLAGGMSVVFSGGSLPTGITAGTIYWVGAMGSSTSCNLYTEYQLTNLVNITATGTGTFTVVQMSIPRCFAYISNYYFMVDSKGLVWTNKNLTFTSGGSGIAGNWVYAGNKVPGTTFTNGNGLVGYSASDGTDYLFIFHNSTVDYIKGPAASVPIFVYQWQPTTGTNAGYSASPGTPVLKTQLGVTNSHEAIVAPDNKVYYCDSNWVGRFYQADPTVAFDPATVATYVFDNTAVLPFTEIANCLAPLGNNLLIGGNKNTVYPWDTFSSLALYPILLAENNVQKMVTVNTNTYIFVGNRGRIWVTNGSQAQLYKKLPDHLSGTVEPYYTWGAAGSNKNQLYFGALATTNAGSSISQYGGLWAIDLESKALRMTNKLSYGTYAGYPTVIISNFYSNPAGTGLYIGWNSGASTYGIDTTSSSPYSAGEAYIDSDLIPMGTFLQPTTNGRIEFKLTTPLVSGESLQFYYRQKFSDAFTAVNASEVDNGLFNTVGQYSGICRSVNFENSQWLQIRVALTSTASTPSYVRLNEIRIGK